ncbi:MAG: DNA mismatch repair endonuclease MutL [Tissierellia bacterium]|nr:DNA mismatch repair endonuclease MutL [Tissierellia bacterium]
MKIKLLNDDTIQKIAAGEVVERPQSIIKELVENSVDARSDEIVVEIKKGGKEFIKVSDNGTGIDKDQIEKAFLRHATSKINSFEDLYKVYTMGFRGEALASIVAVSTLDIYSKTDQDSTGSHLSYDNNKLVSKKNIGMNRGTIIEVKKLFEYLPVRKKFLASDIAEANKITAMMYSFAIANPGISISYFKDDKLIFKTFKDNSLKDNLRILFGNDYANNILEVKSDKTQYKIKGYISNNSFYKGNRSMQYVFVNGRYIEDMELISFVESQYHTIIPNNRFPAFQLFIETDPQNIDINISPNKQKIKFSFADDLYDQLKAVINDTLLEAQRIKELKIEEKEDFKPNFYDLNSDDSYQKILNAYKNFDKEKKDQVIRPSDQLEDDKYDPIDGDDLDISIINLDQDYDFENTKLDDFEAKSLDFLEESEKDFTINEDKKVKSNHSSSLNQNLTFDIQVQYLTSFFNRYMIFKKFSKEDLIIVDQIAAQERIVYDKLKEGLDQKKVPTSQLLSPIIVEFGPKDYEKFTLNKDIFKEFGFDIDDFGQNTIAIRAVPYIGDKPLNKDIFINIFDNMSQRSTQDEYLDIIKKKAIAYSINQSHKISEDYALGLYKDLIKSSNKFATESGKKIMFSLSQKDFERILNK